MREVLDDSKVTLSLIRGRVCVEDIKEVGEPPLKSATPFPFPQFHSFERVIFTPYVCILFAGLKV